MKNAITAAILSGAIALSAAAQVRPERQPSRPVPAFPVPRVTVPLERQEGTVNVGPREMKVVHLVRVPDSAFHIESWPGIKLERTAPAPPGGISSPGATIYIQKQWVGQAVSNIGFGCGARSDRLDLSEPRRHGFRLHAAIISFLPPPQGFQETGPWRRGQPYTDAQGRATDDPAQAVRISLTGRTYQLRTVPSIPVSCFTGYRADISLYGPANIDPFTGKAIVREQVN